MRLATTLLLLVLVLGSFGYIVFYERSKPTTQEIQARSGRITHFATSDVEAITVRGPAGKMALRKEEGDNWYISEPFEDRADPRWVEEFLVASSNLLIEESISSSEIGTSFDLAVAGLDDAKFTVEYHLEEGEPVILEIGKSTPLNRTTYIRHLEESEDVLVASGELHPLLSLPQSDLRDRRIFRLDAANLVGFSLRNSRGEIDMERPSSEEFWMLTRPLQTTGHWELIDDLLSQIVTLEYSGVAPSGNGNQRAFEPGETTTVTLLPGGEGASPVTLELIAPDGEDSEKLLARVSDRSPIFKIDARLKPDPRSEPSGASPILLPKPGPKLLDLLNRSPNDLRDDHLANIDQAAVSAISITDLNGQHTVLKRRGEQWWLKGFDEDNKVNYQLANFRAISDFFKTLNRDRVVEFTADSAANLEQYGLDRPYLRILLAGFPESAPDKSDAKPSPFDHVSDAASVEADPEFAREIVNLRIGINRDTGKIYANYEGEPFIYRIDDILLGAAPANPLSWQSLDLLRFAYNKITNINIVRGAEPPTSVACDFNLQRFRAQSGGKDVTHLLDKRRLTGLALTLSGLRASNWANEDKSKVPELENPTLVITMTIDAQQPGGPPQTVQTEVSLCPTVAGRRTAYFYGKLNTRDEAFVVPYATYRTLAGSVIVDPKRPVRPGELDDGLLITPEESSKPVRPAPAEPAPPETDPAAETEESGASTAIPSSETPPVDSPSTDTPPADPSGPPESEAPIEPASPPLPPAPLPDR